MMMTSDYDSRLGDWIGRIGWIVVGVLIGFLFGLGMHS